MKIQLQANEDLFNRANQLAAGLKSLAGFVQNDNIFTEEEVNTFVGEMNAMVADLVRWKNETVFKLQCGKISDDQAAHLIRTREYLQFIPSLPHERPIQSYVPLANDNNFITDLQPLDDVAF